MKNDKNERTRRTKLEKQTRTKKSIRSGILLIAVKTKSDQWLRKCETWRSGKEEKWKSGKVERNGYESGGMVMKPARLPCCKFLLALGPDRAQRSKAFLTF